MKEVKAIYTGDPEEGDTVTQDRKFKAGDAVYIPKYTAYPMIVLDYVDDPRANEERVVVCWFNQDGDLREAGFKEEVLRGTKEEAFA